MFVDWRGRDPPFVTVAPSGACAFLGGSHVGLLHLPSWGPEVALGTGPSWVLGCGEMISRQLGPSNLSDCEWNVLS